MRKVEFKGLNKLPKLTQPESSKAETEPCFDWISWWCPFHPTVWGRGNVGVAPDPHPGLPESPGVAGSSSWCCRPGWGAATAGVGSGETPCPHLQSAGGPSAGTKTASHEQQRVELPHCLTWNNSPCVPPRDIKWALGLDAPGFAFMLCHPTSLRLWVLAPASFYLCPVAIIMISLYILLKYSWLTMISTAQHKFFEERVLLTCISLVMFTVLCVAGHLKAFTMWVPFMTGLRRCWIKNYAGLRNHLVWLPPKEFLRPGKVKFTKRIWWKQQGGND